MNSKQAAKPLRFVTNYGAPHPKRRRIGAACLTCRKRKTACSGERPFCDTCRQNKLECAGYASEQESQNRKSQADSRQVSHGDIDPALQNDTHRPQPKSISYTPPVVPTAMDAPQASLFSGPRNRMPYFRWLGPTAIMPGFKQMVVKIKRHDTDAATSSADGGPVLSPPVKRANSDTRNIPGMSTPATIDDARTPLNLPFYDTSPMPPSELITHLAQTFFTHLGCNYPFLQRERFMRDLEEKQVDAILVDAVCALAARFSTHALLIQQQVGDDSKPSPADYGHAFAQRAKVALTDTFACPTVAAVQAALLLAYNEFGESRDSGLWVYLGLAIRMAQDLGMHKVEGLRYRGVTGPTPRMVKMQNRGNTTRSVEHSTSTPEDESEQDIDEQKAVEQERVDTFWAVFFLDRVVSSGTGRRGTLRDKDIELSFPLLSEVDAKSGWPEPFPALIRIMHLYGRVTDLLNSIKESGDITPDTPKRLAVMESQVTHFYQGLSTKLHFDAVNFQYYVKAGEGTNFVLLHFWFHTLIVLLHQPTILKTFEGRMLQLFPNSQALSMSSAKTIADILSYSQLIDARACLGNPFTTQPIYIAACAFLRETEQHTAPSNAQSRATSPKQTQESVRAESQERNLKPDKIAMSKHTLLATVATQHYQLCYKSLKSLETYWAGTKYILTVLEQKFEGISDPLLYTVEEGESAMEKPKPYAAFKKPGWRRTHSFSRESSDFAIPGVDFNTRFWEGLPPSERKGSASKAIGWTLTGNMDSSSTNLAWHYPSARQGATTSVSPNVRESAAQNSNNAKASPLSATGERPSNNYTVTSSDVSDASLLLGLHSPFDQAGNHQYQAYNRQHIQPGSDYQGMTSTPSTGMSNDLFAGSGMMIEQQDIDTSMLSLDMMPWFDASYGMNNADILAMYDATQLQDQHDGHHQPQPNGDLSRS